MNALIILNGTITTIPIDENGCLKRWNESFINNIYLNISQCWNDSKNRFVH